MRRPFCMRVKNRKKIVRKTVMILAVAGFNRKIKGRW